MLSQIMETVRVWIEQIIAALGYPGITVVMLAENLFPPIPSELVMPFAGFMVARGTYSLFWTVFAGTLGSVLGALALYYVGMFAGEPLVRPFFRRYGRFFLLREADLDRTLAAFDRHGDMIVLGGRVVPLVRSLISLPAGMNRMPIGRFLLFTAVGSAAWTALLTTAGMILGANWQLVLGVVDRYQKLVVLAIALAAIIFVARRVLAMRQPSAEAAADM
ncbi:DedA family protein [Oscillochloris sp. ZM17-4]|uniref:DedA family protein n=1 Tax=Oscillochloris sp. ZM17-4 TaxID=2866714 RepID=UPI001C73A8ED|nr:DedA family protein [Oscillochloris sp. ZM17-4]MBX0328053.1 DedA family protein [Oscillochloris sp. ZM17-4]